MAFIEDLTDGRLDGFDVTGEPVEADPDGTGSLGPTPFPALDATGVGAWIDATNSWLAEREIALVVPRIELRGFGDITRDVPEFRCHATGGGYLAAIGSDEFRGPFRPHTVTASCDTGRLPGLTFEDGFFNPDDWSSSFQRGLGVFFDTDGALERVTMSIRRGLGGFGPGWQASRDAMQGISFEWSGACGAPFSITFEDAELPSASGSGSSIS